MGDTNGPTRRRYRPGGHQPRLGKAGGLARPGSGRSSAAVSADALEMLEPRSFAAWARSSSAWPTRVPRLGV